jgi:predicted transcriptional regulator
MSKTFLFAESTLYEAASLYVVNLTQHWQAFAGKTTFITAETASIVNNLMQAASALPNQQQRKINTKQATIEKNNIAATVRAAFQDLKFYIECGFKEQTKDELAAAGGNYYHAARCNQAKLRSLIQQMVDFVANNTQQLTEKGNMPTAFPQKIYDLKTSVQNCIEQRTNIDNGATQEKNGKDTADQALYDYLMVISKAAARVFVHDELMLDLFVFDRVLWRITGTKPGSIKGEILDENNRGIPNIVVALKENQRQTKTDKKGQFKFARLRANTYTLQLPTLPPHRVAPITVDVQQGKTVRVKEVLPPMEGVE